MANFYRRSFLRDSLKLPAFNLSVTFAAAVLAANLQSCQKASSSDNAPGATALALVNPANISAEFKFPATSWQILAAPTSHSLAGASISVPPLAFFDPITISMEEALPIITPDLISELKLSAPVNGDGRAVLFSASEPLDAREPMAITVPWSGRRPEESKNLVVIYHRIMRELGGRTEVGILPMADVQVGSNTVTFRTPFFGGYQVGFFNGDPSTVIPVQTSRALFAANDAALNAPEAFAIQTPSGTLASQNPLASWSLSRGAVSYDLAITSDKDCTQVVKSYRGISSLSRTLDNLTEGSYFACVTAVSQGGTRTFAINNGFGFTLVNSQLGLFQLTSTRSYAVASPTFTWTAAAGAAAYQIQVATSAGCGGAVETAIVNEARYTLSSRRSDGTYWVCITAVDPQGNRMPITSDPSRPIGEGLSFTIDTTAPGQFSIKGIGGPRNAVAWALSSEALYYNLTIATDSQCANVVRRYDRIVSTTGLLLADGLTDGQPYYVCASACDAVGNLRAAGNSGQQFNYDITAPKVLAVSTTKPNGHYSVGEVVDIDVTLSEATSCSANTALLTLNTNAQAKFVSGCGTAVWLFRYTVAPGEFATKLDYQAATSLALGSAEASDMVGNLLLPVLPAPGSQPSLSGVSNISIDTITPSIVSTSPTGGAADAAIQTEVIVNLSEDVIPAAAAAVTVTRIADGAVFGNYVGRYDSAARAIKLALKPNTTLQAKTNYTVTVRGVRDLAGNELLEQAFSFSTK